MRCARCIQLVGVLSLLSFQSLLHFRYGLSDAEPPTGPLDKRWDMSVVKVAVRGTPDANDLLSCLSLELSPIGEDRGRQQVIFKPSDVVAFQLLRDNIVPTVLRSDKHTFVFPTSVYLDQFLSANSNLASEKRNLQRELRTKVDHLKERKEQLRWHEVNLSSHCLHYVISNEAILRVEMFSKICALHFTITRTSQTTATMKLVEFILKT